MFPQQPPQIPPHVWHQCRIPPKLRFPTPEEPTKATCSRGNTLGCSVPSLSLKCTFLSWIEVKLRRLRETPNPHIWNRSEVISRYHYILCTICQTLTAVRNAFFCQQKRKGCPEFKKTFHKTRRFNAIFFQFQDLGSTLRTQYINQIY